MNKTAVVTIATNSYFAQAKVLLKSLRDTNPQWDRYCVIADDILEEIVLQLKDLGTGLIEIEELDLPDINDMKFRYRRSEFAMSLKPYAILYLLKEYERVVFLDSDICVFRALHEIENSFEKGYNIILTPHIVRPYQDDRKKPNSLDIICAGVINTGMVAVDHSENAGKAMQWWAEKLAKECIQKPKKGLVGDQKWLEILPAVYDNVLLLRNSAYNVAYWNLEPDSISESEQGITVQGEPLAFFHFSGFDPKQPDLITKYHSRYAMWEIGRASVLYEQYAKALLENGYDYWSAKENSYGFFHDGKRIDDVFRLAFRENRWIRKRIGNRDPFDCASLFYRNKIWMKLRYFK